MMLRSGSWYGDTLRENAVAGLLLTETAYRSGAKLPSHSHEQPYFCFVLKGAYTENYGRRARACQSLNLIFHPPDETHANHFHSDARCFNLQMSVAWMERLGRHSIALPESAQFERGLLTRLATRLYEEFRREEALSHLVIEGLMLELIGETCRQPTQRQMTTPPRWLSQARDQLHEQFADRLTLTELAEAVGIHPVHLAREFRRFYGCTVGEYLRRLRVEFACRKIALTDQPLSEIAMAAGFFDQSHFTRLFKQQTGKSPKAYRRLFHAR